MRIKNEYEKAKDILNIFIYMKDLARRTAYDKFIRHKAFNVEKNSLYDGYQQGLA